MCRNGGRRKRGVARRDIRFWHQTEVLSERRLRPFVTLSRTPATGECSMNQTVGPRQRNNGTLSDRWRCDWCFRLVDQRVMEVAVAGTLHDRLRPLEAHALIVALAERGVA